MEIVLTSISNLFLCEADFFKDTQAEKYQSRYVAISFSKEFVGQLSQASN